MTTEYELTFSDYISIMRRRAPYLIGTFVVVLVIAVISAFIIPPTFRATGTIIVESQQVPDGMVPRTIKNDELDARINVIKQRVMTREGMMQIISKYQLYKDNTGIKSNTDLIEKMRSQVNVESINSNDPRTSQQGLPAIAFTVSFDDRRPDVALQVTNDLVTLFLDWNIKLRTEGATETTTFLSQESNRLKTEVDNLEEKIRTYKKQNRDNLPEQLNLRESMLERAKNDLYAVDRDIRSGNEELRSLEAELSAAKHGMSDDPSQTLPSLKAEYTKLSAIYTQSHPDIKALKRKIDALEQGSSTSDAQNSSTNVTSLSVFKIQAKVDAVNARLDSLEQQKTMLHEKINQNEHAMELTPQVAEGLDVLTRDRDSAQKKFEELRNKKMNAQIAQNLESENKSERFTLLEPPILPEKPIKPNRKLILLLGFVLAIASGSGVTMLLESIDKRIRGTEAITHLLGCRPIVVIPYIPIHEESVQKKRMLKWVYITAVVFLTAGMVLIHFLYMPLNVLFVKFLARLA